MRSLTAVATATGGDPLSQGLAWLTTPEHWLGPTGVGARVAEHLGYTAITIVVAAAFALPAGLFVGHTGRGRYGVLAVTGLLRSLPTLGVMTLVALLTGLGYFPPLLALVLLAVPPLLTSSAAGIADVDRALVDAARGQGMTEWQILWRVEVPQGLTVMVGGVRSCVLQVVATTVVIAYLPYGGLGRFLIDGLKSNDYGQVLAAAALVAVLALLLDTALAFVWRLSRPSYEKGKQ